MELIFRDAEFLPSRDRAFLGILPFTIQAYNSDGRDSSPQPSPNLSETPDDGFYLLHYFSISGKIIKLRAQPALRIYPAITSWKKNNAKKEKQRGGKRGVGLLNR